MFGRRKVSHRDAISLFIGEGCTVEGNITSKGNMRIDGKIVGDIVCEGDVSIGASGSAESNIAANNIHTAGAIYGTVAARGQLVITRTGKVDGNIQARSLRIAEGGVFQGTSKMPSKAVGLPSSSDKEAEFPVSDIQPHLKKKAKEAAAK
jgi:Integral membrane protein CcmA involved in cell shape determination